jgi:hypothetical protein
MTEEEAWEPKAQKPRRRRCRARRSRRGSMARMDTSVHHWFGTDEPRACLIGMIDDASQNAFMRFYDTDSTETSMDCMPGCISTYGIPNSIYTDRAAHFHCNPPGTPARKRGKPGTDEIMTQVERAMKECGIRHITAHSPQAKGRVERMFGTLQDRLIHRMRIDGVKNIEDADTFLEKEHISKRNERFGAPPADSFDAHKPVGGLNLKAIFSIQCTRVVSNNYTINGRRFRIEAAGAAPGLKKGRVTVEQRLNCGIRIRFRGERLYMHEILRR